ncbi:MAG: DUF5989 family protein [Candidatus Coatesbacteria bacterium]
MKGVGRWFRHAFGLARDLGAYAWLYRAWWLIPVVTVLFLLGLLIVAGSKALVFVYPLF